MSFINNNINQNDIYGTVSDISHLGLGTGTGLNACDSASRRLGSNSTQPMLAQLESAQQEADDRIYELVGEILVNIGRNIQLLECEQEQLKVDSTLVNRHINDLKIVHQAELEAVIQDFQAKMYSISLKIKVIVDRFKWIKETFIAGDVNSAFRDVLRSLSVNGNSQVEGYYKSAGMVRVRYDFDAILEDEGCESIIADWLKIVTDEMSEETGKKMFNIWGSLEEMDRAINAGESATTTSINKPLPNPNLTSVTSISNRVLSTLLSENQLIVQKLTKRPMEKLRVVEIATEEKRLALRALNEKKELMVKAQSHKLSNFKLLLAAKFMENLDKANFYYNLLQKYENNVDQFSGCVDPRRSDGRLLVDPYLGYLKEGYNQELKLIQDHIKPIISTLNPYIAEYGKAVIENRKLKCPDYKTTIEELIDMFRRFADKGYTEEYRKLREREREKVVEEHSK